MSRSTIQLRNAGYAKAIEQLGNDNLDVRLGGIYSLEQVAADSPRDRDHATVVEVLSAFVRVHSEPLYQYKAARSETATAPAHAALLAEPDEEQHRKAAEYVAKLNHPPVDVQAAITVLGRLLHREGVSRGDLAGANLAKVNLDGANLTKANLQDVDLSGASWMGRT